MIHNPILKGFHPDPSIVRVGEDYYIATSTFEWWPGIRLHHSTDLVHWELIEYPLNRTSQLDLRGVGASQGVWAPCLTYDKGTFYLLYTVVTAFYCNMYDTNNYLVTATVPAITNKYKGIHTPQDLYDRLSDIWCADTCAPRLRDGWTPENKTLGQCSITAFLVQDIFGGKVYGILRPGGNYHCYNDVNGHIFDLTSEQFGDETLSYKNNPEQFREVHFAKEEKRLRYEYLKQQLACLNQQSTC